MGGGVFSLKVALAKSLTAPLIGKLVAIVCGNRIPCRGLRFNTADPLIHPSVKASLFWGLYESAEIRFVNRYLPLCLDVIELGSSIGVLSCFIRKKIDPKCKLVCVEADPRFNKHWNANLALNQCLHNVHLLNQAISYSQKDETRVSFVSGTKNADGRLGFPGAGNEAIEAEPIRLSDIIAKHISEDFSLVSDIEGAEVELLYSESEAFKRCRFAVMELHKSTINEKAIEVYDTLERLTGSLGFRIVDRNGPVVCLAK